VRALPAADRFPARRQVAVGDRFRAPTTSILCDVAAIETHPGVMRVIDDDVLTQQEIDFSLTFIAQPTESGRSGCESDVCARRLTE
jgi:hypothetical protein